MKIYYLLLKEIVENLIFLGLVGYDYIFYQDKDHSDQYEDYLKMKNNISDTH